MNQKWTKIILQRNIIEWRNEGDEKISIYHLIIGIENYKASVMLFMIITES